MTKRPFNVSAILTSCQAGEKVTVTGIIPDDLLYLRTWANRKGLYVQKTAEGAIIMPDKPTTARGEITRQLGGETPFCVSNETANYVRTIVNQFNMKSKPSTPWKVKKLSEREFMIYQEPAIPEPKLL